MGAGGPNDCPYLGNDCRKMTKTMRRLSGDGCTSNDISPEFHFLCNFANWVPQTAFALVLLQRTKKGLCRGIFADLQDGPKRAE